jgi:hypothetical protein
MNTSRLHHHLVVIVACSLLLLAAACGPNNPVTPGPAVSGSPTATSGTSSGNTSPPSGKPGTPSSSGVTTAPMPTTQTSCPQPMFQAGRAAVIRPLALGSHDNIAYIFNEGTKNPLPSFAELKRYDVTTGNKTVIVHLPNTTISSAQVSADGQWLLFVSDFFETGPAGGYTELQLVRMDGQGLQTLYCAPLMTLSDVQWSPDQKYVVFSLLFVPGNLEMYLLNLGTGAVQHEFSPNDKNSRYFARTWLDNTRVYLERHLNRHNPIIRKACISSIQRRVQSNTRMICCQHFR